MALVEVIVNLLHSWLLRERLRLLVSHKPHSLLALAHISRLLESLRQGKANLHGRLLRRNNLLRLTQWFNVRFPSKRHHLLLASTLAELHSQLVLIVRVRAFNQLVPSLQSESFSQELLVLVGAIVV